MATLYDASATSAAGEAENTVVAQRVREAHCASLICSWSRTNDAKIIPKLRLKREREVGAVLVCNSISIDEPMIGRYIGNLSFSATFRARSSLCGSLERKLQKSCSVRLANPHQEVFLVHQQALSLRHRRRELICIFICFYYST